MTRRKLLQPRRKYNNPKLFLRKCVTRYQGKSMSFITLYKRMYVLRRCLSGNIYKKIVIALLSLSNSVDCLIGLKRITRG